MASSTIKGLSRGLPLLRPAWHGSTEVRGMAVARERLNARLGLNSTELPKSSLSSLQVDGIVQMRTFKTTATTMVSSPELQYDYSSEFSDCEDHRRHINGGLTHKALLVDAAGTLMVPSQPAAQIYRKIGKKYGVKYTEDEILARYRWAYSQPWCRSILRYVDDGRPFWQFIVEHATGCSDKLYFEELYQFYATAEAWHIADPEAGKVFETLRNAGVKLGVVSNFDTRLRPLLQALDCDHWFDALAVSAEVIHCMAIPVGAGYKISLSDQSEVELDGVTVSPWNPISIQVQAEKPNPTIFLRACELLGVDPEDAVHVGDDRRNDVWGARDARCDAWLWGEDVYTFKEVAERMGVEVA